MPQVRAINISSRRSVDDELLTDASAVVSAVVSAVDYVDGCVALCPCVHQRRCEAGADSQVGTNCIKPKTTCVEPLADA